jgi:glutathione S-transferase
MAKVEEWKRQIATELATCASELRGDYLAGDAITAADLVLYPMIGYVKRITFRKPETKLTDAVPGKLLAWAKRIEELPYFDKTFPPHWK